MHPKDGTVKINTHSIYSTHPITRRDILSLIQGPGAPKKYMLSVDSVIGRSPEASIQIRSNMVSRKHISLKRENSELICTDLMSHNGLFLNGIKIHSATLRDGDTIQIGDIIFLYNQGVQWTSM
jgi:pSer/pThr/pTyr-binding forkhead associated (FHA) protein